MPSVHLPPWIARQAAELLARPGHAWLLQGPSGLGQFELALALAAEGARVGMLDADIYGPSQPTMMGVHGSPEHDGQAMQPLIGHGVQVNSIGLMVKQRQTMIWRGPMVTQALDQLMRQTA